MPARLRVFLLLRQNERFLPAAALQPLVRAQVRARRPRHREERTRFL